MLDGQDIPISIGLALRPVKRALARVSYHNRNVPVSSTIEMSPGCRFTKPQKRSAFSFADIDFFSRDD